MDSVSENADSLVDNSDFLYSAKMLIALFSGLILSSVLVLLLIFLLVPRNAIGSANKTPLKSYKVFSMPVDRT